MFTRMVVGLDGSRPADEAAEVALMLSGESGAEVIFASVIEELPPYVSSHEEINAESADARTYYGSLHARWLEQARQRGVPARSALLQGHEAHELLRFVGAERADLLLIGYAGHSTAWENALGGTANQLLLRAPCSVLVTRSRAGWTGRFGALAVGLDGSPVGWDAFDVALAIATRTRAPLMVISVTEQSGPSLPAPTLATSGGNTDDTGETKNAVTRATGPLTQPRISSLWSRMQARAVARATSAGVSLELATLDGSATDALIRMVRERDIDLLILGATGHERPWNPTAGGTARKVAEEAPCAVMLVRPAGAALTAADVMEPVTTTVEPETPLTEILSLLLDGETRLVNVTNQQGAFMGLLTLTTLVNWLRPALNKAYGPASDAAGARQAMERLLDSHVAREAMITHAQTIQPTAPLYLAARFLIGRHLTRAPVVDVHQRLLGVISEQNIVRALTSQRDQTGRDSSAETASSKLPVGEAKGERELTIAGTVAALLDRAIPFLLRSAPVEETLEAVARAPRGLVLIVDDEGRYVGVIDERGVLQRALPVANDPGAWQVALTRLLAGSPGGALAAKWRRPGSSTEPMTTASLVQHAIPTFTLDTPVTDALASMIATHESDCGVALTADQKPIGVLWRQSALRAVIRG